MLEMFGTFKEKTSLFSERFSFVGIYSLLQPIEVYYYIISCLQGDNIQKCTTQ